MNTARDKIHEISVAIAFVTSEEILSVDCRANGLGRGRDLGKHSDCLDGKLSYCRFFGQHDAIGAIQDGVGHIGGFSSGRAFAAHH